MGVGQADTQSSADDDGDNPSTQNRTEVADVSVVEGLAAIGAATSRADVEEAVDGTVRAIGETAITEPSSLLGALITVAAITASSRSVADGTSSDNVIDFLLTGLALRTTPGGEPLISFDAGPDDDPDLVRVTATIGGLTETFTLPRGSNLLDAASFSGTNLAFAAALAPVLSALTGAGGPLEGSELILADGFSDDGDGTFARGLIEVVRLSGSLGGDSVGSIVLGRAFSAADAERSFSTATNPDLPQGETPTSDPDDSFTTTREATPAETIFTNPVGPGSLSLASTGAAGDGGGGEAGGGSFDERAGGGSTGAALARQPEARRPGLIDRAHRLFQALEKSDHRRARRAAQPLEAQLAADRIEDRRDRLGLMDVEPYEGHTLRHGRHLP